MSGQSPSSKAWVNWIKLGLLALGFSALVIVLMLWLAGRFSPKVPRAFASSPSSSTQPDRPPVAARLVRVPVVESAVGTIRAISETAIASKLLGRVVELNMRAGQEVHKNDVLVRLDDTELRARLQQAMAVADSAKAVRDNAATEQARMATMLKGNVATQAEFDKADAALKTAEAEVRRADEAVKEATSLLDYTTIRAPMDGTIVDKKINAGDTAMPGQVLGTLYDPRHMQLVASVRESLAYQLKVGQQIGVRVDVLNKTCGGEIAEIVPEAQSASRTFQVKVTGPCPPGIYSGVFGRILIPLEDEEVLVIPQGAVHKVGQLELVDVWENGQVQRRAIRTGRLIEGGCEVLSGLTAGEKVVPDNMDLVITRNYGLTADEKVNDLVEGLAVAILIVIALLTLGLGWREAFIVAVAVPVVFGLTLGVNLLLGFTINRVTLFALILSLGLLVDDPIVDVENISRHFALRKKATRRIVIEAVAEIRPPLITATLAVIVSFLPMFFITGMMGPYMRPMALNVPVTMIMSMVVAFTITPWLAYHMLKRRYRKGAAAPPEHGHDDPHDLGAIKQSVLYRFFYPLMAPLLRSRARAWLFLLVMGALTLGAAGLAATRSVPLKMLPFDNKNELLLVLDFDKGTTLERSDAAVRDFESYLRHVPELTDFTSYVGVASPMDFNGLVRHYYLRQGDNVAELRINLAGKRNRAQQSHGIGLRMRDELTAIAARHRVKMKLVETPPGPPVIASVVAEVYGRPDHQYEDLLATADVVGERMKREPGVVDVDDVRETAQKKLVYVTDKEKAALSGITTEQIAGTLSAAISGAEASTVHAPDERSPLRIELRLPVTQRSSSADLARLHVKGDTGQLVSLAELGKWETARVDQTIYHKNLNRVAYVFAETAGRPPADVVIDIQKDRMGSGDPVKAGAIRAGNGSIEDAKPRPIEKRTFLSSGGGIHWQVPDGFKIDFAGEGEWKITLDVFRDLGLAFGAAMVAIYILLVAQTKSFVIPLVVMMAIPLTILGVMPGFWLLNAVGADQVGQYRDAIFFTATGMIGMIALAGIVTRDSIILVDFIHLSLARGRSLFDAIMESRVVRLRPILLTAGAAMLSAVPIIVDPIFSGLAWSLIFGLLASTVFTLFVIPIAYWLLYSKKAGHGLPQHGLDDADDLPPHYTVSPRPGDTPAAGSGAHHAGS